MARPTWPDGVRGDGGGILRDGYRYEPPDSVIESNPGPAMKRRPRSTAAWEQHTVRLRLPNAEWSLFKDWVRDDLIDGTLSFDWTPPEDGAPRQSEFVTQDGRPYSVVPAPGANKFVDLVIKCLVRS